MALRHNWSYTLVTSERPPVTEDGVCEPSAQFREPLDYFAILERLASLNPKLLACMHGSVCRDERSIMPRKLSSVLPA